MAETLLSPGILTRENDQTLITEGPITAGAAILGPTVKGPVNIPTLVLVPSAKPDDLPEVLPVNLVPVTTPATILFPL